LAFQPIHRDERLSVMLGDLVNRRAVAIWTAMKLAADVS
jgi:hypothetical protein